MTALAIVGLVVGFVVLLVVIRLLNNTLKPLLAILADVQDANTAPMLQRGIPGPDKLGETRRLADSVPPLALAYLAKLGARAAPAPPAYSPPAYSPPPASTPAPPAYAAAPAAPSGPGRQQGLDAPVSPAWRNRV